MDQATGSALSALTEAVRAQDRGRVAGLARAVLATSPPDLTAARAAELYRALALLLAEQGLVDAAFEAHVRALEAMARDNPEPRLVLLEIDALIALAEARQSFAMAARLQSIAIDLTRTVEGAESAELAARLQSLTALQARIAPSAPPSTPSPAAAAAATAAGATAAGAAAPAARARRVAPPPPPAADRDREQMAAPALESAASEAPAMARAPAVEERAAFARPAQAAEQYQKVDVYFATTRAPTDSSNPYKHFSGRRNDGASGPLHTYGIAEVSVPRRRTAGSLPTPGWLQRHPGFHSDELYLLKKIRALSEADWDKELTGHIAARPKREALIYVHGYNIAFWEAMLRAAQLHADLDIDGVVAAYSWPSRGNIFYYLSDRQELVSPHFDELKRIIKTIALAGNVGRITVVAHSMGCEFLLQALERLQMELAADPSRELPLIKDVIFAAPDVDVVHFTGVVQKLTLANRISVYTSESDQALSWGRWLVSTYDRAGNNPAKLAVALAGRASGVDTIDTTEMTAGGLGHSDYSTSAIDDLRAVVWLSLMPARRPTLIQRWTANGGPAFWVYRAGSTDRETYRQALQLARQHGGVAEALSALQSGALGLAEIAGAPGDTTRQGQLAQALRALA